jgi:hypothetical protein
MWTHVSLNAEIVWEDVIWRAILVWEDEAGGDPVVLEKSGRVHLGADGTPEEALKRACDAASAQDGVLR